MKQIIINYDEYLELEKKSKKLDEIKSFIEIHDVENTALKAIVPEIIMNDKLKRSLVLLKRSNYLDKIC